MPVVNFVVPPSLSNIGAGTLAVDLPLASGKNITLLGAGRVYFGNSGTLDGTTRNIVGTSTGVYMAVPSGLVLLGFVGTLGHFGIGGYSDGTNSGAGAWQIGQNSSSFAYAAGSASGDLTFNARMGRQIFGYINGTEVVRFHTNGIDLSVNSKKVIFGSGGSATAANREAVGTPAGIDYNVPTNLAHTFRANNVSQGTWDGINGVAVISAVNSSTLKLNPGGGYAASDYAILAASGTGNVHNVPTNTAHIFRVNNVTTVSIGLDLWVGSAAKIDWGSTAGAATVTAGSNQILNEWTGISQNVKTGDRYLRKINGSIVENLSIGSIQWFVPIYANTGCSAIDLSGANTKLIFGSAGSVTAANREIVGDANGTAYTVPTGVQHVFYVNSNYKLKIGGSALDLADGVHLILGSTMGTKIGAATTQKLSFWNKTPVVQPTTAISGATLVSGGGTTITSTDTFGGYTLQQIAAALQTIGILA